MQNHPGPILLAAALLAASCGGTDARVSVTEPTLVSVGSSASFRAASPTTAAQIVGNPSCPAVPPLNVPVGLVVQVTGDVSIVITEIRLRFTDTFGAQTPQVTLPAPMLTTQFGTALVEARSQRTFPLIVGIGCGTARRGTVVILVDTRDDHGRRQSGQVSVAVH